MLGLLLARTCLAGGREKIYAILLTGTCLLSRKIVEEEWCFVDKIGRGQLRVKKMKNKENMNKINNTNTYGKVKHLNKYTKFSMSLGFRQE